MRTTIEITAEQRSKLLALAALRNKNGFSELVREALDAYLDNQFAHKDRVERALRLRGVLAGEDAAELEGNAATVREQWR